MSNVTLLISFVGRVPGHCHWHVAATMPTCPTQSALQKVAIETTAAVMSAKQRSPGYDEDPDSAKSRWRPDCTTEQRSLTSATKRST